jgi:hypothetical protein
MISFIKAIYSRPFRRETRSIGQILIYRAVSVLIWIGYFLKYCGVLSVTRKLLQSKRREVVAAGKCAFVFANGPSLQALDFGKIKSLVDSGKFDLIAINSFLSKSAHMLKPTYAVFADNVHFTGANDQYAADVRACESLNITYFVPAKYAHRDSSYRLGYCSLCDLDSSNVADVTRPAGYYGVTAFFAVSLAKALGYDRVFICGFDNSYFKDFEVDAEEGMILRHRHYYDANGADCRVRCLYESSSEFFFDTYRHFACIEKICAGSGQIRNIAKTTYLSSVPLDYSLDVYK